MQDSESTTLEKTYTQLDPRSHVLQHPDTYIGGTDLISEEVYVIKCGVLEKRAVEYVPALLHCLDEAIVNARDHVFRQLVKIGNGDATQFPVSCIDVGYDAESQSFYVENDGNGIDIAIHPTTNIWIPEMVFGHLRTSTNYDDVEREKTFIGGMNGYGIKAVNV